MKKLVMMAVMAIVAVSASAQVYLGGSLGYKNVDMESKEDALNTLTINPEIGYNLDDNWAIGIGLGFGYSKQGDASTTTFTVNPYARYTFARIDKVKFFLDGSVEFGTVKPKDVDAQNAWGIGIKPGIAFDVNDKISLVAHVGFLGYEDTHKIDGNKTFGLNLDNNLSLGFYYNF